jgi:single-strand DNA-binding protein
MQENFFILAGYLGTKPEVRYLPSGTPVANARLAQSMKFQKDGQLCEHTNWFNLVFYGDKLVEVALSYEKGDNIHVTGVLEHRQWETPGGAKRNVYEVAVRRCHRIAEYEADSRESQLVPSVTESPEGMKANANGILDDNDDWVI